ncbi:hypothetical protein D3C80_1777640 [compost metagenome]
MQEQRADFRLAGHFVAQKQGRDLALDTQVCRGIDRHPHAVVVPGLSQTNGTAQGTDTDDLLVVILEYEQIVGVGLFNLVGEGALGPAQAMAQALFVGGQGGEAGAGALCQCQQRTQVSQLSRAHDHDGAP